MLIPVICISIGLVVFLSERIAKKHTHRKHKKLSRERAHRYVPIGGI